MLAAAFANTRSTRQSVRPRFGARGGLPVFLRRHCFAIKKQLDRYRLATDDDIYILSRFHPGADNQQMIAVEAFIGVKSPHLASAVTHTVAAAGRYLMVSFTGSWQEYASLSNYIYINVLPRYGLCRRQGDDIECFSRDDRQCAQTGQDLYTLTYYVPVMNL